METSECISMAALLVASVSALAAAISAVAAAVSAYFSKRAADESKKSNEISIRSILRTPRLAVKSSMKKFADFFVSESNKMRRTNPLKDTGKLPNAIKSFKSEIDQHGPLGMPEIEKKASEFVTKAWHLQRVLDRIAGGQNQPFDEKLEDEKDKFIAWFVDEQRNLDQLFEPYLKEKL